MKQYEAKKIKNIVLTDRIAAIVYSDKIKIVNL